MLEYSKHCVAHPDVDTSASRTCSQYLSAWYSDRGFDDQNGMQPTNASATWGEIQTTLYYQGVDSFNSLVPFNTYIYADANPATLDLQNIVVYMIAEGTGIRRFVTVPKCSFLRMFEFVRTEER